LKFNQKALAKKILKFSSQNSRQILQTEIEQSQNMSLMQRKIMKQIRERRKQ
jgi:hypothetical protein